MKLRAVSLLIVIGMIVLANRCFAVEAWADPGLRVTAGLELWLDAARVPAADAAHRRPATSDHQAVEVWRDASGHHRDATQPQPVRRPAFWDGLVKGNAEPALHFDGQADGLSILNGCGDLRNMTLFIVAAPYSNLGRYRGIFSCNQTGKNDYQSGFNIDLGRESQTRCNEINVEGGGFAGEKNLVGAPLNLGTFHVFTVDMSGSEARLLVDGQPRGSRPRMDAPIRADEMRIGMRYYGENGSAPSDGSFFDGCIAEVLLYRRALSADERRQVESYLQQKHAGLLKLTGPPAKPLVQMFVPGFSVRELQVKLTNINCVTYSPDGLLYALGYDGRIFVLRDTTGDGLEDPADVWWDKSTLRTPIAMAWRPDGLYVVSNGKISVLRDSKHTGKADTEEVIVSNWPKDGGHTGGNVDALGIAFDSDNNLYFGLGCADYSNPYLVRDGKPHYDIHSQRGSILKVSADRKHREIICSGIRFPYSIAFNKGGDLFCTDQEGETWCPGGNPRDELDYIIPGRHYGFPPRNAKYLPDVHDEPPAVSFGPQHQSTCGFVFDEPAADHPMFGPKRWEGDAIIAGFSRGKLWRARLAKTPTRYIGRESIIASLRLLTLSPAISPKGDIVVACHGGLPDWGSGPKGIGKLFKISYTDKAAPQPVLAWAQSPVEVRVAFDRPVDPGWIDTSRIAITYGQYVRAGDRFEAFRPGYATVESQTHAFRSALRVTAAALSQDRRTLRITTDPHPMQAWYGLSIPLRASPLPDGQEAVIELAYDLSGVSAQWTPAGQSAPAWTGWLPHADLDVARRFTTGSAEHDRLFQLLQTPGTLRLSTTVRVAEPSVSLRCEGPTAIELKARSNGASASASGQSVNVVCDTKNGPVGVTMSLKTDAGMTVLHVSEHTADDPTERPLPLTWEYPAWAPRVLPAPPPAGPNPDLAGADWKRGQALFFGTQANCATCHTVREKGGHIGPDLSNLTHRDTASVLRDIVDPNVTINPDHIAYTLMLKDGRELNGLVRSEGKDDMRVIDSHAVETLVHRREVVKLQASAISIMPEGYAKRGQAKLKDLLMFLTTEAPKAGDARGAGVGPGAAEATKAADLSKPTDAPKAADAPEPPPIAAPPARTRAEVDAILKPAADAPSAAPTRTLHIVLVAGPKDHGPGEHDYPEWQKRWQPLLAKAPKVEVTTAFGRPDQKVWKSADVMIFYCWGPQFWDDASYKQLDAFLARGGGLVLLHSAVISAKEPQKLADRIGYGWISAGAKYRHGAHDLVFTAKDNPITQGFSKLHMVDEDYWPIMGRTKDAEVLATTADDGGDWPMLWTCQRGKGRVFATILGHYLWTFDDPLARTLILRGIAWSAGEPIHRLEPLALDGVKLRGGK